MRMAPDSRGPRRVVDVQRAVVADADCGRRVGAAQRVGADEHAAAGALGVERGHLLERLLGLGRARPRAILHVQQEHVAHARLLSIAPARPGRHRS
jgi:hypothetical protein